MSVSPEGGSQTRPTWSLRLIVTLAALFVTIAAARAEVQIERTFLPDAHASSFAFGLPGGVSFCYDPVRGGLNYAWTGDFLDLTNVRPVNKLVKAAELRGPVVYRETGLAPLRRGDARRVPAIEFKGYTLRAEEVELRYMIDGVPVRETIAALPNRAGLRRTFRFDGAGADAAWFHVVDGHPATALTRGPSGTFVIEHRFNPPTP